MEIAGGWVQRFPLTSVLAPKVAYFPTRVSSPKVREVPGGLQASKMCVGPRHHLPPGSCTSARALGANISLGTCSLGRRWPLSQPEPRREAKEENFPEDLEWVSDVSRFSVFLHPFKCRLGQPLKKWADAASILVCTG